MDSQGRCGTFVVDMGQDAGLGRKRRDGPISGSQTPDGRDVRRIPAEDERLIRDCLLEARKLRRELAQLSLDALAEKFGVARPTIAKVRTRMIADGEMN